MTLLRPACVMTDLTDHHVSLDQFCLTQTKTALGSPAKGLSSATYLVSMGFKHPGRQQQRCCSHLWPSCVVVFRDPGPSLLPHGNCAEERHWKLGICQMTNYISYHSMISAMLVYQGLKTKQAEKKKNIECLPSYCAWKQGIQPSKSCCTGTFNQPGCTKDNPHTSPLQVHCRGPKQGL